MVDTLPEIRQLLPAYDIGGELGRGAMGVVVSARHRQLNRTVAIKELPPGLCDDPDVRRRFVTEARVLASLTHPHIVPVFDYVEAGNRCLLVMEHLEGGTLWSRATTEGLRHEEASALVLAICAALEHAHGHRVLHRDLKPENVLFTAEGTLKVADFGIAKVLGGGETLATTAGEILGTPAYMAPEQAEGGDVGPAADVFAVGVMLYELLSGTLPYSEEGGALAIIYRHVYESPIPLGETAPDVPPALQAVTMRALSRAPQERFPTADELGVALAEAAAGAWGPGWLTGVDVPLTLPPRILAAAATHVPAAAGTPAGGRMQGPPSGRGRAPSTRIRPATDVRAMAPRQPANLRPDDLVPVGAVLAPPRRPLALSLVTVLLLAAVALIAAFGATDRTAAPGSEGITVAGRGVTSDRPVPLDLGAPIPVAVSDPPPGANQARLELTVADLPLGRTSTEALTVGPAGHEALLNGRASRYLLGGAATAELVLLATDDELARYPFAVTSASNGFISVPGGLAGVLVLMLIAHTESLLRVHRRSRRLRVAAFIGMTILGAGYGALAVVVVSLLGIREPQASIAVVCAVLGGIAGVCAALVARRAGARSRARRASRAHPARRTG